MYKYACVFSFAILSMVSGYYVEVLRQNGSDPAYPHQCVYEGIVLDIVQSHPLSDKCCEVYCNSDYTYSIYCCETLIADPPCVLTEKPELEFPDCCPQIDCGHVY